MRYEVREKESKLEFEIENFEIEKVNDKSSYINASSLDKWLTIIAVVVIVFLGVAGIYGMYLGGDFSAVASIWTEIKTPLFATALFLVRGKIDEKSE